MADIVIVRAKCRIFLPNYRIVRSQFNVDEGKETFGQYINTNLLREHGVLEDGLWYEVTFKPLLAR